MILVTGGTGLIGNTIARRLLARRDMVRLLVRRPQSRSVAGLKAELMVGEVTDPATVTRAVRGASLVIHCAAMVRIGRRGLAEFRRVNVGGTKCVAEACRAQGVRMVHVSTVDAFEWGTLAKPSNEQSAPVTDPGIPYVTSKRESQALVLAEVERGLDARIVNPTFVLGPWDWKRTSGRLLIEAIERPWLPAPAGGNDFCHAEDVAAGILTAGERNGGRGECFILGGVHHTYRQAFAIFRQAAGVSLTKAYTLPTAVMKIAGFAGDIAGLFTGGDLALNSAAIYAGSHEHHFDDRKARRELHYQSTSLTKAAAETLLFFRQNRMIRT